jgi:SHS2 domain-containing protein
MDADFVYLEHTADAEFIAYGRTIEEAFVNAARATFNLMVDENKVRHVAVKDIELEGDMLDTLLYDWVSELLYLFEVEKLLFGKFEVSITNEDGLFKLKGKVYGEEIDQARHEVSLHIKAVTFHDLRVEKVNNTYEAQILLDI